MESMRPMTEPHKTVLDTLANTPIEEGSRSHHPRNPPKIDSAKLVDVTRVDNPYRGLRVVEGIGATLDAAGGSASGSTTQPSDTPSPEAPASPAVQPKPQP